MDFEANNIQECCRICLINTQDDEVFEIDSQVVQQISRIAQPLKFKQSEYLSRIICTFCYNQLQNCIEFRSRIIENQEKIINFLKSNTRNEDEEVEENLEETPQPNNCELLYEIVDDSNEDDDASVDQFLAYQESLLESSKPKKIMNVLDIEELHIFAEKPKKNSKNIEDMPDVEDCDDCCLQISTICEPKEQETTETFTCDELNCKYNFKNKVNLKIHKIIYHMDLVNENNECIYCNKSFKEKRILKRHLLSHLNISRFDCKFCDRKFKLKHHLKNHIDHVHNTQSLENFLCSVCGKSFTSKRSLNDHIVKFHCAEGFTCSICEKIFTTKRALCDHQEVHNEANEFNLLCNVCGLEFQTKSNFTLHLKSKCMKSEKASAYSTPAPSECGSSTLSTVTSTSSKANCQYFCKVCNVLIGDKQELDSHNKLLHTNIFNCSLCPKQFVIQKTFENHLLTHTEERKHVCLICDVKFKRADHLNLHFLRKHSKCRAYKCNECSSAFTTNCELKIHQRKHSGIKPFQCTRCEKCYTQSHQLAAHERSVHFNQRPYHCTVCSKSFCTAAILNNHLNIHNFALGAGNA